MISVGGEVDMAVAVDSMPDGDENTGGVVGYVMDFVHPGRRRSTALEKAKLNKSSVSSCK